MSHAAQRLLRCVPGLRPVYRATHEWLRRLCAAEQEAMDRGDLASDFSFIVARKRVAG